jgi:hypothetical protein
MDHFVELKDEILSIACQAEKRRLMPILAKSILPTARPHGNQTHGKTLTIAKLSNRVGEVVTVTRPMS